MKTPDSTNKAESSALDSVKFTAPARFTGTDNPRQLRSIAALLRRRVLAWLAKRGRAAHA